VALHMASNYSLRSIPQRDKTIISVYAAVTVASVSAVQYEDC
jgi:hypothetical protein